MDRHAPSFRPSALGLQIAGILIGFAGLAAIPPATGRMLLVPIGFHSAAAMLPETLDTGARLLGHGPLPRSYVVMGDRARLFTRMARLGVVVLAAPPAGCGATGAAA